MGALELNNNLLNQLIEETQETRMLLKSMLEGIQTAKTASHPEYMNEQQVAEYTGVKVGTLRNHRAKHQGLPYAKIDGRIVYLKKDIDAYVENNRVVP